MEREAERTAFARACSYLNYKPLHKWLAYCSGVGSSVLFVALLGVLGLLADLVVGRGQLPTLRELTPAEQSRLARDWNRDSEESQLARTAALTNIGLPKEQADEWAPKPWSVLPSDVRERLWRRQLRERLTARVGEESAAVVDGSEFDDPKHGILGLVARADLQGKFYARPLGWFASWNPWMWRSGTGFVSSYLLGLFLVALALLTVRAGLMVLMHDSAARTSIEAANRMRRSVYHHSFRLGTLAVRALGPSEAVTVFTRHVEAVHDALHARLTVQFREWTKFALLLLLAVLVDWTLAAACVLFATLVWLIGGQATVYFRRRGREATNRASEWLTLIRESLMLMRLVKCYMMERFNQSRVERQLARYSDAQRRSYRSEALARPVLYVLGAFAAMCLLYVAGVIVLSGKVSVAGLIVLTTALVSLYGPVTL